MSLLPLDLLPLPLRLLWLVPPLLALLPLALLVPVPVLGVLVVLPHRRGVDWRNTFG
jgi:hypothetical protein